MMNGMRTMKTIKRLRSRTGWTIGLMLGAVLGMCAGAGGAAVAAPAGGAVTSSVFLAGTGKVIGQGDSARLDATIECVKGVTWSVGPDSGTFAFAEIGRDDTFAQPDVQSGKCNGKLQKIKVGITAYYNPPIPRNCSAEYSIDFSFSDGSLVHVDHATGAGVNNGPVICLT